jgi:hypothetical protein
VGNNGKNRGNFAKKTRKLKKTTTQRPSKNNEPKTVSRAAGRGERRRRK